jgi:acetyl esterase/lipase
MLRPLALLLAVASTSTVAAVELKVYGDLAYAGTDNPRQTLDVYTLSGAKNRPIVVYIHGGGWRRGDKGGVGQKAGWLIEQGYILVSVNYRFVPDVSIREMTGDIARAIRWTREHAGEYGGAGEKIVVMGHSAGAHLAALVCTDESYLKAEGLSLAAVKGCVPIDVSVYDIPKRLAEGGSTPPATFTAVFGRTEEAQREASPTLHVAQGKHIPPFLILYVADRPETKSQSQAFAEKLRAAGVAAEVVAGEGKTHGTINSELGDPDDEPTKAVAAFLRGL